MILFVAIISGFIFHLFFPQLTIQNFQGYNFLLYSLLAIGLYGAVCGIELTELHRHRFLILRAITLGVIIKSLMIGSIFWFLFHSPYAFLFGIIVAQIDPLSVAHLIDKKSQAFSTAGRTILRAWSSFDDPMTILLALYLFLPLVISNQSSFSLDTYLLQFGTNILFASVIYFLRIGLKKFNIDSILLVIAFIIAISYQLMLGIALVGLFLRPTLRYLPMLIQGAFIISAIILGSLLIINQQNVLFGISLGCLAFFAQAIATLLVAPKLKRADKLYIAFAQYNGITAIILALIIAFWIPEVVSIVAIAIITINLLYYLSNNLVNTYLLRVTKETRIR